tara:strand:+ start:731 stop:1030 length:300 start_codon:yes stop_codon:yes gene_type:complete
MATKGTNAKIKELKGIKPEKVNDEELKDIQAIISKINQTYIEMGRLEAVKHNQLHTLAGVQDELMIVQDKLKAEYGTDDINIQTGEIKYPENGEVNKKD